MKILPRDPKKFLPLSDLDDSRLGNHVQATQWENLKDAPHGFVLTGFADDSGVKNVGGRAGAAAGPEKLREKLYRFTTGALRLPVYDLGDLQAQSSLEHTHEAGAKITRHIHETGHIPIIIGGGHDLGFPHALGLLQHAERKRSAFVNIDAHLDVRPVTHGITSGSPWFLLREHPLFIRSKSKIEEFGLQEHCNSRVLVEYAMRHQFGLYWLKDLRKTGKVTASFQALLRKCSLLDHVLVSLDIDSVQWSDAPGCSAPQNLGFTAAEVIELSRLAGQCKKVKSFGLFELSPPLDPDGKTATLAAHCISGFLQGKGAWKTLKN
jgi:formimidoylglutamase